jgi:hypothetical protein
MHNFPHGNVVDLMENPSLDSVIQAKAHGRQLKNLHIKIGAIRKQGNLMSSLRQPPGLEPAGTSFSRGPEKTE